MSYCESGDKPTVEYQFASQPKRTYQSEVAPIDVEIIQIPGNTNGSGENVLYEITFQYWAGATYPGFICGQPSNVISKVQVWGKIGSITGCEPVCGSSSSSTALNIYLDCRGQGTTPGTYKNYRIQVPGTPGYNFQQIENPQILDIKKISSFSDPTDLDCKIVVSHAGKVIFTDVGKCPGTFDVLCREECPPETCCECSCGDVICCYGSNGQVLKTIRK